MSSFLGGNDPTRTTTIAAVLLLTGVVLLTTGLAAPPVAYTLQGDTVFVDVAGRGKIEQTPHTLADLRNSPEVSFTSGFESAIELDVAFGFDTDLAKPTRVLLRDPHTEREVKSFTCDPPRRLEFTTDPARFSCWFDRTQLNNETGESIVVSTELVFEHGFDSLNEDANTAIWLETREVEWTDVTDGLSLSETDFGGKSLWYTVSYGEVGPGEKVTILPTIQVKPRIGGNSGKYDVCVKPSSLSFIEAQAQGTLVCLDPWWDVGWLYKRAITVTNNDGSEAISSGYTLNVTFDHASYVSAGKSNANGTDVRVLENDDSEADSVLCLGSAWNTSTTCIQFNLTSTLSAGSSNSTGFQLYYGNPTAGTRQENLSNVFMVGEDWDSDTGHYPWQSEMTGGSCSSSISGGMLHLDNLDKQASCLYWLDLADVGPSSIGSYRAQFWFNYSWSGEASAVAFLSVSDTNATGWDGPIFAGFRRTYGGGGYSLLYDDNGLGDSAGTNVPSSSATRTNVTQIVDGTAELLSLNASSQADSMTALSGSMRYFYIASNQETGGSGLSGDASVDDVRLMHYHSPEPTTSLGSEVQVSTEVQARLAIEDGIEGALASPVIETDQQVYVVIENGSHYLGSFDKTTQQGNQTWAFNYVSGNETFTGMPSLFTVLNVWENESIGTGEITSQVEAFINQTVG